jgi:cytoskeletal protein RodZ
MAKIGSRILETRLRKGLTLDRIADDTNISVRFLSKIENDDFTGFPGEPYVVGFIRNYADYLGMEPEEIVALYRRKEEDTPLPSLAIPAETLESPAAPAAPPSPPIVASPTVASSPSTLASPTIAAPPSEKSPPAAETEKTGAVATVTAGATVAADIAGSDPEEALSPAKAKRTKKKPGPDATASGMVRTQATDPVPPPAHTAVPTTGSTHGSTKTASPRRVVHKEAEAKTPIQPQAVRQQKKSPALTMRTGITGIAAILIVGSAILWIFAGGKTSSVTSDTKAKQPMEYRVEGAPFEKRLYIGDSLLVPLGDDVYKIRLASIADTVNLETPFGPFKLSLGEAGFIDPDKNGKPDASLIVGDFEKNHQASGALLRVEFAPPETETQTQGEITISGNTAAPQSTPAAADTIILKSTRGPYPFVVQVTFRGNCLFRYEADRKEWVEKYYSKGENITINVSSALTVWASNAQAAKLSFQATGGKTADLEIGAPGEIAVKNIGWSKADGTWALVSSNLD